MYILIIHRCYTCCSETAYSASDACCDSADSFAALLILLKILN